VATRRSKLRVTYPRYPLHRYFPLINAFRLADTFAAMDDARRDRRLLEAASPSDQTPRSLTASAQKAQKDIPRHASGETPRCNCASHLKPCPELVVSDASYRRSALVPRSKGDLSCRLAPVPVGERCRSLAKGVRTHIGHPSLWRVGRRCPPYGDALLRSAFRRAVTVAE